MSSCFGNHSAQKDKGPFVYALVSEAPPLSSLAQGSIRRTIIMVEEQPRDDNASPPDTATSTKIKVAEAIDVTMHPLVLLSAADHYHRVAKGTRKRVVGVLLGQVNKGNIDASNSFAVPFEEDSRNPVSFQTSRRMVPPHKCPWIGHLTWVFLPLPCK